MTRVRPGPWFDELTTNGDNVWPFSLYPQAPLCGSLDLREKERIVPTSPLLSAQAESEAVLVEKHGWRLPAVYSSMAEEYRAATQAAGLVDRSFVGRLEIRGADGLDLLDRLSTNRLEDLVVGRVMHTVLTSNKGRNSFKSPASAGQGQSATSLMPLRP